MAITNGNQLIMKAKYFTFYLLVVVLIKHAPRLYGCDAHPYPIQFIQPDSSKIEIIMMGDEKTRWAETMDGFSILFDKNGTYVYACKDKDKNMIASDVKAKNPAERNTNDLMFLSDISKHLVYSQSQDVNFSKSLAKSNNQATKYFPTKGNRKLVCILIGFTDKPFTKTKTDFENLFNQTGYNFNSATGSFNQYYLENSYNQLNISTTVVGPYTASNTMAYYGTNSPSQDYNLDELLTEALALANPDINFADFDTDTDGVIDGVYVIYAGNGEESGGGANTIYAQAWPYQSVLGNADGKNVSRVAFSSELNLAATTNITGIGTICHEFGHLLGALDFYDTNGGSGGQYDGTGQWDVMAKGRTNNALKTPAHHNLYNKTTVFGWANYTTIGSSGIYSLSNAAENSNSFYRINTETDNEYFLIENRQKTKFDSSLPGHGMLIYHVDGNYMSTVGNAINAGIHQGMYTVCANATANPTTTYGTINSGGCPFPGTSNISAFTDYTTPSAISWSGYLTNKPISNIQENTTTKTISFEFMTITGLNENNQNNPLAYPNPCKNQLTLRSKFNDRKTMYALLNSLGQTVLAGEYLNSIILDVSHFHLKPCTKNIYYALKKELLSQFSATINQ